MKNKKFWISLLAGLLALTMILGLIVSILPHASAAKSSDEIQDEIDQLKQEQEANNAKLKELEKQKAENLADMQEVANQKALVEQQVSLLHAQVENINEQIAAYAVMIADKQEELDAAEEKLAALNEKHKERIRAMEEDGNISYWSVLFQANSFADLLDRLNMIEEIAAADQRRLKEISEAAKEVEAAKEILLEERAALDESKAALSESEAELDKKIEEADGLLAQLIEKDSEYQEMLEDSEELQHQLMQEIAQAEDDFDAAKDREYQEWLAQQQQIGGNYKEVNGIKWVVPCDYTKVSSPFGPRTHPITGEKGKQHDGVDLVGPYPGEIYGKEIYATRSGKVTKTAYQHGGAGYYVSISHGDGYASIYMHMTHYIVKAGQYVNAGQVIGYVGNSGGSTGAHLHFGISYNGEYIDPMQFIG